MQTLNITLEWFLNPDHLPMIAGIRSGAYAQQGIAVRLVEPEDHYDGFTALERGEIDLHVNEPIHLFEHYSPGICSLGCFFETDGGVLMRADRIGKLRGGETVRICTPAAEPETNRIGFEILRRYAVKIKTVLKFGRNKSNLFRQVFTTSTICCKTAAWTAHGFVSTILKRWKRSRGGWILCSSTKNKACIPTFPRWN